MFCNEECQHKQFLYSALGGADYILYLPIVCTQPVIQVI